MQTLFNQVRAYEMTLPAAKDWSKYNRDQFMKGRLVVTHAAMGYSGLRNDFSTALVSSDNSTQPTNAMLTNTITLRIFFSHLHHEDLPRARDTFTRKFVQVNLKDSLRPTRSAPIRVERPARTGENGQSPR